MLHVNNRDGFTIAVSENKHLARIAKRTVLSDNAFSIVLPMLQHVSGWQTAEIRRLFETYGLTLHEWDKASTDRITVKAPAPLDGAGVRWRWIRRPSNPGLGGHGRVRRLLFHAPVAAHARADGRRPHVDRLRGPPARASGGGGEPPRLRGRGLDGAALPARDGGGGSRGRPPRSDASVG